VSVDQAAEAHYELARSIPMVIPTVIAATGRPELIERYALPMRDGLRFGTFAYTERTEAFDFRCRVVRCGDGYLLDGEKCLQTGGHLAGVFLTYVRDESGDIQLFLVERSDPGVRVAPWRPRASARQA
jgi:alkylation response protein AidB-like acyl-CoA dehydrogenase